jgi:hypothetical protein
LVGFVSSVPCAGAARVAAVAWLAIAPIGEAAAQASSPGYSLEELALPSNAFLGGFEVLPSGNFAVFDGTSVLELSSSDGSLVQTIFTPPAPVFGAFLRLSPDGAKLYFGESSDGKIHEIDLATLGAAEVLDTVFPFDLAFDPQGRPFLSYSLTFPGGSFVALCDFSNGSLDDVIDSPDASGPLAFDADGNLYTATPDTSSFPPPADATEVLRFAAADVDSAIGSGSLGVDAGELIGLVDGAFGLALDEVADVLVSDPNYGVLVEVDAATGDERVLAVSGFPFAGFTHLRHARGSRGAFEPWQPSEAGQLLAVHSDFFTFNELAGVRPARPQLSTTPASPIPPGQFTFDVTGAVPDGFGLLLITGGAAADETALRNRTWPAPLFLGLDFTGGLIVVPIVTDVLGELHETADNPGLGGATLALQLVAGAAAGGPWFGTSPALEIVLQ